MTTFYYECYNCQRTVRSEDVDDGHSGFERIYDQDCGCIDRQREAKRNEEWDD
jgi:hypothetical protein